MIGNTIRAVLDLLMLRKTERKLDADIAKAPLDKQKAEFDVKKAPLDLRKTELEVQKLERQRAAGLELAEVAVVDDGKANLWSTCPTIDIKLVNQTEKTIFVKCIEIGVMRTWRFPSLHIPAMLQESTASYDIEIPGDSVAPFNLVKRVSHALKPGEVDRFQIVLHQGMKSCDNPDIAYLAQVKVIHGSENKVSTSQSFLFGVKQFLNTYHSNYGDKWESAQLRRCRNMAIEIEGFSLEKSDLLQKILRDIAAAS
jgi:hypothetical protein